MSAVSQVSLLGLDRRFRDDAQVLTHLVLEVSREPRAMLGPRVARFEAALAEQLGVPHAIAVGSCTGAILVALRAAGIGAGDRVVVPAFGHMAPAAAVVRAGAEPLFVDVRDQDLTLDPALLSGVSDYEVVMPVHQFTALADMTEICAQAERRGAWVLEDSAVALGAGTPGRLAGTLGRIGVFSFHPVKVFGTVGDAGLVVTHDNALAERIRKIRNHGQGAERFVYDALGWNSRMDEILAGHLLHRLPRLNDLIDRRIAVVTRYLTGLEGVPGLRLPAFRQVDRLAYVLTVRCAQRDRLAAKLRADGIETAVQYPIPLPHAPAFRTHAQARESFPVAERAGREVLSLPLHADLTDAEVDHVIARVRAACV
jgi:dTDP-4-amino-4,6-dideoxygalactose transaminase